MIKVIPAQTGHALEYLITLSQEYVTWMIAEIPKHFPELDIDAMNAEHDYDDIRKKFPGEHVSPYGCLLIAMSDDQVCGCIAVGKLTKTICEMRTLFVRPAFRGLGVGKRLVEASINESRQFGYSYMRLDSLKFMTNAHELYYSFGFYDIAPYRDMPTSLTQYIRFLELNLTQ